MSDQSYPYWCRLGVSIKGNFLYYESLELSKTSKPNQGDVIWLIQNRIINRFYFKEKDFHAPHSWLKASGLAGCVVIDVEIVGKDDTEEYRFTLHNTIGKCFQLYDERRKGKGMIDMEPVDRDGKHWDCVDLEAIAEED